MVDIYLLLRYNKSMSKRWKTSKTSVFNIGYHFIWCPKYRRKVLIGKIEEKLKYYIEEKSKNIGIDIISMEVMPDHVHIFVKSEPVDSPHWIIGQIKGFTSRKLREEFPSLKRRLPTLWTRSYYCESVGHISEETIKKYIEEQKNK